MSKVLILGLGNDLMTDDAVGLRVAHEVRSRLAGNPHIEVKESGEMGLALLDLIVDREALIVVDSIETGRQPAGYVHQFEVQELPEKPARSPHSLGLRQLYVLARARRLSVPHHVTVFAIEIRDAFTVGTDMTPEVEQAIDDAADLVAQRALEFASSLASGVH